MSDWSNEGGETELGAQVEQPTRQEYAFSCSSCGVSGQWFADASDAQSEGVQHELTQHARSFTVIQRGAY